MINCNIHGLAAMDSCPRCEEDNPYFQEGLTKSHSHQWSNYLHTAYVLIRKPQDHHCKLCSDCGQLLCEGE
jgi:hypothetical protein